MTFDISATLELARWWWTFVVRGVLAIAFGIVAFFAPGLGIAVLVGLFAAWVLIDGITGLWAGFRSRGRDRSWWIEVVEGLVSITAGVLAVAFPVFAAEILVLLIAAWAIVTGALEIVTAIRLRDRITGELWLGLTGAASVLFGIVLVAFPGAGALSLVWLIGGFAVAFGGFLVVLGIRLQRIHTQARTGAEPRSA
ncbi:MAG: HdeD family acid-resistance protein [Chloroflexi bacterium]|nr:HdeD family acid-resistance protein [Chloroflexota bacterium]